MLGVKRKISLSIVINEVSFDCIISNVKSQIAFLIYRTARQKKRYYIFNPFFFCCAVDISKMSFWSAFTRIVTVFITSFVGVHRSWQTCRSLARLCVDFHPSLKKKRLHSPSHLCAWKRGYVCLFMLNMMRNWELGESLISLRTGWWKCRVRMHTFVPSDENVTLFSCGEIYSLMELETHIFDLNKISSCFR